MRIIAVAVVVAVLQQPTPRRSLPEHAVIDGKLGPCAAEFTVKDADGKPVYAATVRVRVRYGLMSIRRMDLEVGTDADGRGRIEGLPTKARPLAYEIVKGEKKAAAEQDVAKKCDATFEVTLK